MKQITHTQQDVIQSLATQLISLALKYHVIPWLNPVRSDADNCGLPLDIATQAPFDAVSTLLLQIAAQRQNYTAHWWGTADIWKELGGLVRHNEQSTWVAVPDKEDAYVYHIEQVDSEEVDQFPPLDYASIGTEEIDLAPLQKLANKHGCEPSDFTSQDVLFVLSVLANWADLRVGKVTEMTFREMATEICVGWLATELRCPLPACHAGREDVIEIWIAEMHENSSWDRRKNNCLILHPLTLPSPPRGEGTYDSCFFVDPWVFRVCERARKMMELVLRS